LYYSGALQYTLTDLNGVVFRSNNNYPFNDPTNLSSNPGIAFWTIDSNISAGGYNLMSISSLGLNIAVSNVTFNIPCFKEGSKILTDKGYKLVEHLKKGDLVKTLLHDYKPISLIGKKEIYHPASNNRIKEQLYQCSSNKYPELFEPLVLTGAHSILVDNFANQQQREKVVETLGEIYVTDGKYRLPACVDGRACVFLKEGTYTIYHLALENDNYFYNYGIYANGLLVESCSKRYLKELSNMELIE